MRMRMRAGGMLVFDSIHSLQKTLSRLGCWLSRVHVLCPQIFLCDVGAAAPRSAGHGPEHLPICRNDASVR